MIHWRVLVEPFAGEEKRRVVLNTGMYTEMGEEDNKMTERQADIEGILVFVSPPFSSRLRRIQSSATVASDNATGSVAWASSPSGSPTHRTHPPHTSQVAVHVRMPCLVAMALCYL